MNHRLGYLRHHGLCFDGMNSLLTFLGKDFLRMRHHSFMYRLRGDRLYLCRDRLTFLRSGAFDYSRGDLRSLNRLNDCRPLHDLRYWLR